jgi:hypothetical protein
MLRSTTGRPGAGIVSLSSHAFGKKLTSVVNVHLISMVHANLRRRYAAAHHQITGARRQRDSPRFALLYREMHDLDREMSSLPIARLSNAPLLVTPTLPHPAPVATIVQAQAAQHVIPPNQISLTFTANRGATIRSLNSALFEWATPRNLDIALLLDEHEISVMELIIVSQNLDQPSERQQLTVNSFCLYTMHGMRTSSAAKMPVGLSSVWQDSWFVMFRSFHITIY